MRVIRAIAFLGFLSLALLVAAGPASAQTTTTLPGTLPVTGAPGTGGEPAALPEGDLARTGIELIPVVNTAIGMIFAGAVLLVALEVQRSGRRERSLWTY